MNSKIKALRDIASDINTLSKYKDTFAEDTKDPTCDKKGMGFNLDERFSAFGCTIHFDSWKGFYGDSGCSRVIYVQDREQVSKALAGAIQLLEKEIIETMVYLLNRDAKAIVAAARAELVDDLATCDALDGLTHR